jgi:hypothetical protein
MLQEAVAMARLKRTTDSSCCDIAAMKVSNGSGKRIGSTAMAGRGRNSMKLKGERRHEEGLGRRIPQELRIQEE